MKIRELRDLGLDDLIEADREARGNYFRLQFQHSIRRLSNPAKLTQLRKDIARIQTILTEKKSNI